MNDPQTWTTIGVLATLMLGGFGFMFATTRSWIGSLNTKIDAVDTKTDALDSKFDAKFDALDIKIDSVDQRNKERFDSVNGRLGSIESDLTLVKAHLLGVRAS